ncbi:hypothetical protein TTRE_0000265501 [Trichuris trichiura]|uniref:Uncharacterized protein n=1 Tax=Trichuris trichiura TaxID=36087 RepID=A0A077Z6T0_TRITR|nr:hypothetical protein TTRE_0000265501 [Trichuris trichiura]
MNLGTIGQPEAVDIEHRFLRVSGVPFAGRSASIELLSIRGRPTG